MLALNLPSSQKSVYLETCVLCIWKAVLKNLHLYFTSVLLFDESLMICICNVLLLHFTVYSICSLHVYIKTYLYNRIERECEYRRRQLQTSVRHQRPDPRTQRRSVREADRKELFFPSSFSFL